MCFYRVPQPGLFSHWLRASPRDFTLLCDWSVVRSPAWNAISWGWAGTLSGRCHTAGVKPGPLIGQNLHHLTRHWPLIGGEATAGFTRDLTGDKRPAAAQQRDNDTIRMVAGKGFILIVSLSLSVASISLQNMDRMIIKLKKKLTLNYFLYSYRSNFIEHTVVYCPNFELGFIKAVVDKSEFCLRQDNRIKGPL